MNYVNLKLTDDEAKYVIHHLERRKEVVCKSEMMDIDHVIKKFHKAIDELTVEILYRDLEKLRKLEFVSKG